MKFLGREPAQWVGLLAGFLVLLTPLLHLSVDLHGALLAVIVAIGGIVTAAAAGGEKAAPLVAGLIKALIAVALALHFELTPELQSGIMVFVEAGVAWYLRTQIVAPVSPAPAPVGAEQAA